jgi:putative hydrolase of the HAD superfamily
MRREPDIEAVVLDSGGVLLLPDPDAMRAAVAPFGVVPDDETCRAAHYASDAELDRLGLLDWREVDRVVASRLGVPDQQLEAGALAMEPVYTAARWVPIAGAAEALHALQAGGYQLAIVSNAHGSMEQYLAEHRICSVDTDETAEVAVVVDSAVVGIEKPDPRIFDFALDALGVSADRCLYVGDTIHFDVAGSRAAGLHPVHLDPYGWCPYDDHRHVASLDDLVTQLVA